MWIYLRSGMFAAALVAVFALAAAPNAQAEEPPAGAVPFPTNKTQTLRGKGTVFYIDGAVVIPKKVEISVELNTSIIGINKASLEVLGALRVRGTQDHWVKITNVDFSPTRAPFRGVHLDMVDLRTCRFVHTGGAAFDGVLTIENACLQRDCAFDVRMAKGELNLLTITWGVPCAITLEPPAGKSPAIIVQCHSSLMKRTTLRGRGDIRVRSSEIRGGLVAEDMLKLTVDGCDISQELVVRQPAAGNFKGIKLTKCNLWDGTVVRLGRPSAPKQKKERVFLQKFFFGAKDGSQTVTSKEGQAKLVHSDSDTVRIRLDKPRKRKHQLVDYDLMNLRVPMLNG